MNERDPSKIDTPTAVAVGKETLAYVLREINDELGKVRQRLDDVLLNQRQYTSAVQAFLVEHERVTKKVGEHNRRIKRLESVVYEGGTAPEMRGPPDKRRPILPPPENLEDSWNSRLPPEFMATLSDVARREGERKKRESFFWKANWKLAYALAAALIVGGAGAAIGWVVAHSGAPSSEVRK